MSSVVSLHDVSFELPNGRELFSHLHLSLGPSLTALIGPNGIGKTCLARIVAGELEPTRGTIRRNGPVAFLPQRLEPDAIPVAAFLGEEHAWSPLRERLLETIDPEALCTTLSGGEWMRVRLAAVASDSFLVLDEPTNDLDRDGRDAVQHFLREHTAGALLISHDRACLQLCDEIVELSNRGLARFGGGWSEYEEAKQLERDRLSRALDVAKRTRDQAKTQIAERRAKQDKRNRKGAATAARGGIPKILAGGLKRRAEVTSGAIEEATVSRANDAVRAAHEAFNALKVDPVMYADVGGEAIPSGKLVAEARSFNIRLADWLYREDLDFSWRGNVRVALKGANGSGKSTLIRALMGEELDTRGQLRHGALETLYVDQRCASLDDRLSVFENVREVSTLSDSEIRNALARFLFAKEEVFQKVATLSGGERLRAALARGLLATRKPQLLILDEPTNNLDLANVEFLERLTSAFHGALIVISHDEMFLERAGVTQELRIST